MPRVQPGRQPLQPKQAIIISLIAIIGAPIGGVLSHIFLLTPINPTFFWSALVFYFALGISWSFLRWDTRKAAIRGNNAFVIFTLFILLVVIATGNDFEAFPKWAIVALIIGGMCGYSVIGICAIKNFLKWWRGELSNE